jgi:hypothetical protein
MEGSMKSLMTLVFIAVLASSAWQFYAGCAAAVGTPWQRIKNAFHCSTTIIWAFAVRTIDALAGSVDGIAGWMNMPEVQAIVQRFLAPEAAMVMTLVIAVVTEIARRRSLRRARDGSLAAGGV